MDRDLLSWFSPRDTPNSFRLDSPDFALQARAFSLLLLLAPLAVMQSDVGAAALRGVWGARLEATVLVLALLATALYLWKRPKRVLATSNGLSLGRGKTLRLIAWSRVLDVRELPWLRSSPRWYPKRFQVDLQGDERFDFVGRPDSREIVTHFVKRSEAS